MEFVKKMIDDQSLTKLLFDGDNKFFIATIFLTLFGFDTAFNPIKEKFTYYLIFSTPSPRPSSIGNSSLSRTTFLKHFKTKNKLYFKSV